MFFSLHFPTFLTNWLKLETRDWALKPSCCLSARNENNKSTTLKWQILVLCGRYLVNLTWSSPGRWIPSRHAWRPRNLGLHQASWRCRPGTPDEGGLLFEKYHEREWKLYNAWDYTGVPFSFSNVKITLTWIKMLTLAPENVIMSLRPDNILWHSLANS